MSIAVNAEQIALQASIRKWASATGPLSTVRALEPALGTTGDALARHWSELAGLGVFGIAVPEEFGGAGGAPLDLAAALEEMAAALVPGPILPTLLASMLLTSLAHRPAATALLPKIAAGDASVAVALDTEGLTATPLPGGALRVSGSTGPVLGAGAVSHLLLAADDDTWFLLPADHPGVLTRALDPVDFSRALGTVELSGAEVAADAVLGAGLRDRVRNTAAALGAVEAAAVAGWCLRTATEHAKVRRQFGRPIGSFQAVKHLCAGMLCRAERATAVAWDATRALSLTLAATPPAAAAANQAADQAVAAAAVVSAGEAALAASAGETAVAASTGEAGLAAAVAGAVALEAAVGNAKDCVQVLGGIGFTWEHDAHLYLRRALALRQLLGGSAQWRARSAHLALAGCRRTLGIPAPAEVERAVRARVAEIAALPAERQRAALSDAGYLAPEWPAPHGLGAGPAEQLTIDAELARAGVARPDLAIAGWAVPTILRHGTAAQRERFAGPSLRGEIVWCQLFSEPEAGSDLAGLRTRAERVPGGWRLTGQKVWTSLAGTADWAICLARTDPEAAKHRGLGYFLVRMREPGITVRPLREITGRSLFNEVFLNGVFVPDDCLVGEPGDGWRLARGTLAFERVAMGRGSSLGEGVESLVAAVAASGRAADPLVLDRLGGLVADGLAVSLLDLRSVLHRLQDTPAAAAAGAAVAKLVGVAQRQAVAEAALEFAGAGGVVAGAATQEFLLSRCLSIAGGTTQILLTVAAERILGLPREG